MQPNIYQTIRDFYDVMQCNVVEITDFSEEHGALIQAYTVSSPIRPKPY